MKPAIPRSSSLAMKAPGTVMRISSAWSRQAHTVSPPESASLTSACLGHGCRRGLFTWQAAVVPPLAATTAAASFSSENLGEVASSADVGWDADVSRLHSTYLLH